jgi:hypothetical protein
MALRRDDPPSNEKEMRLKYVRVLQWSADGDSIKVDMLGEDDSTQSLELGKGCAATLAGALASELEKLNAQGVEQQFIRPKGLQTGKTERGEPVLFMTLEGGVELPLVFQPEVLEPLISELEKLKAVLQPSSSVRWV